MSSEKKPKKYDNAFKREAVRLVIEEGHKQTQLERELGISNGSIGRWRKALEEDNQHPFPGKGFQRPEQAEITRLQKGKRQAKAS